jgi:hypothetical protein
VDDGRPVPIPLYMWTKTRLHPARGAQDGRLVVHKFLSRLVRYMYEVILAEACLLASCALIVWICTISA